MSTSDSKQNLLRRTAKLEKELAAKSYALKIESALEKVSIAAMSMRRSKDLSGIGSLIFKELKRLGFTDLRNTEIVINNDAKETITSYYYSDYGVTGVIELDYRSNPIVRGWAEKMKKASAAFAKIIIREKEMKRWRKYREEVGYRQDPKLNKAKKIYYYSYSIGLGALSISSFKPVSKKQVEILARFRNVFNLSYRRYADIVLVAAQAREAEIELALERVRARTMAMKKSDELPETTFLLFQQLKELGETAAQLSIGIIKEEQGIVELSTTLHGSKLLQTYPIPANDPYFMKKVVKPWRAKQRTLTIEIRGKVLEEYNKWRNSVLKKKIVFPEKQWIVNMVFFSEGMISFSSDKYISQETFQLLERFAGVFDLTYRRFLDLQKAESQAREAKIEAALERVRASSMAMHRSDELDKVIKEVTEQLTVLGFDFDASNITTDPTSAGLYVWNASPAQPIPSGVYIPYKDIDIINWIYSDWASHEGVKTNTFNKAQKNAFFRHYFIYTEARNISDQRKKYILDAKSLIFSFSCRKDFALGLLNYRGIIYTEEQNNILARFAKVFEQSYTRFLDLQKSEAQTRESQIQLALERVRARTMAMQNSEELMEAANLLFQQVQSLGIPVWSCGYNIWEKGEKACTAWMSTQGEIQPSFRVPLTEHRTFIQMNESRLKEESFYVEEVSGEELADHYRYMFSLPDFMKIAMKQLQNFPLPLSQIHHVFNFKHGNLIFLSAEAIPGAWDIFKRFTDVFEQTYIRFLDLQKAETQAREAQIELALERVRARTMAMQKSDELAEAAQLLYHEFGTLGINTITCGYMFIDEKKNIQTAWTVLPDGTLLPNFIDFPLTGDHVLNKRYEDWKQKKPLHIFEIEGEVNKEHHRFLSDYVPPFVVKDIFSKLPDKIVFHCANFSSGYLLILAKDYFSPDDQQIIIRFAKVFEMTYRRFLDLKNAETQGRQAQIELGLERVRNRAMAMQTSEELNALIGTVFTELTKLDLVLTRCVILIYEGNEKGVRWWMANSEAPSVPMNFFVKYADMPFFNEYLKGWQERSLKWQYILEGENKFNTDEFLFKETELSQLPDFVIAGMRAPGRVYLNASFNNFGNLTLASLEPLSDEHFDILLRFAKVFDLTYTRFNDLQQAEAQAREAQIQLALERVRARTMAMHRSEELAETAQVLFHQLQELGGIPDRIAIGVLDEPAGVVNFWSTDQSGSHIDRSFKARLNERKVMAKAYQAWKDHKKSLIIDLHGDDVKEWIQFAREEMGVVIKDEFIRDRRVHNFVFFSHGWILVTTHQPQRPEAIQILERFASVFNLTYRRFLDLEKAEANAREAHIETALERVRAKAMAMHSSKDLSETISVFYRELKSLSVTPRRCGVALMSKETLLAEITTMNTTEQGDSIEVVGQIKMKGHPVLDDVFENWLAQKEYHAVLRGNQIKEYYHVLKPQVTYPDYPHDVVQYGYYFMFKEGDVYAWTDQELTEDELKIYRRFTTVISLTYKRYKDLQQAEAQAREAQIEAGLERVRAKAMAMHNSEDLAETIKVFYRQLDTLSLMPRRCGVGLINKGTRIAELIGMVINEQGETKEITGKLTLTDHPVLENVYNGWIGQQDYYPVLRGNEIKEYYLLVGSQISAQNYPDDAVQFGYFFFFPEGAVYAWAEKEFTEDELKIYRRFGSVLSLTYKRYKDLKQAEAQAREAQIESSLERVRSKTMAMHSSDDVTSATATMFTELERLGIENMRCGIAHYLEHHKMEVWSVSNLADGKVVRGAGLLDTNSIPFWKVFYNTWQKKEDFLYYLMAGKEKEDYFKKISKVQNYLSQSIEDVPDLSIQTYYFAEGSVWAFSLKPHTEEDKQVMKRFASVFSLTFRRYQDLKKAEAQAREATIEAALEKVRGKAMAMHNSNDLSVTASLVFTELRKLGISPIRCGVGLLNKESRKAQLYSATVSSDGDSLSLIGWVMLSKHPVAEKIYDTWLANEDYYPELSGEQLRSYYENLLSGLSLPSVPDGGNGQKQFGTFLSFSVGCLYAWSEAPYNEAEIKILKRFATIIDLTFRRYMELQTSEANAREAVKQAALDRIRADIASMRTIADLDRITPLIWSELTILGIPFIRCGVFIMDEAQQLIHTFLSTPEGKAIAAFHIPYDTPGSFTDILTHWKNKKTYINHWGEVDMMGMADVLVNQGAIATKEQYLRSLPKEGFYLHFLPFLQGMLYVGNLEKLGDEEIELIEHVADAFSTAYARYEDFNKLEAAKQQVEKTLTDLKQAQTQLVQSEKMASLGELTAGIAHEIQNPLNFVNNFSDVSNELLDEMKAELVNGNIGDAIAIAEDVKQNLEKINHHGKRADGIVKGMLLHSRTSSGQKEMTDINSLADEYLRLAYHGLRAKDKSFNAKFETDFDKSVGEINIIPQEIGRVILNLINNAFYAVSERKKTPQSASGGGVIYEPTVTLTTVKDNRKIEIKVKDNGNGITQKVLDKIFQPFFTTKPTGQGTGLGLSLAFDIIKAHGGDIRVETKVGEGSEFIIQLPV